ncbi:SDR family NAD(P)-dependent oxidoreductase [Streptomyces griseocarneus]|uniref:SDR family NAD(P)-dependent oxidoreductase n=1 Tax=Streptomyces griseocarneus TaxID=51201 RepID=UPI00167F0E96|nr:glucose 1-dehydrogenase [Streptomyces griseocarneus]MBZ6472777.1 glucose 1-dehydrogenase [Streptomyces griseocarneus]GHG47272.1 dehydrogenase [Streptomyces griseocarneus]
MTARFTGKTVLVTGGGTGIGRGIALAFAREGASVVVAGRREAALRETVDLVVAEGGRATAVTADVTRGEDVRALVEATVARYGGLDVAVNNVGVLTTPTKVADITEEDWHTTLATNLTGAWLSMKHEIAHMREHGGGAIVNVSSNLGSHKRLANLGAYATSKAAVSTLTRSAALDHIGEGVRINAVSPGPVETPMSSRPGESGTDKAERMRREIPAGRAGTTAEIAAAVLYLASDEAGYAVGTELVLDGGVTA